VECGRAVGSPVLIAFIFSARLAVILGYAIMITVCIQQLPLASISSLKTSSITSKLSLTALQFLHLQTQ